MDSCGALLPFGMLLGANAAFLLPLPQALSLLPLPRTQFPYYFLCCAFSLLP